LVPTPQTDYATPSITIGRIYSAMRPNNTSSDASGVVVMTQSNGRDGLLHLMNADWAQGGCNRLGLCVLL